MADDEKAISLKMVADVLKKLDERLEKVERWMIRDYTADGKPIPGVLDNVAIIASLRPWLIGLGTATVGGLMTNAAVSFFHYAGLLGKGP